MSTLTIGIAIAVYTQLPICGEFIGRAKTDRTSHMTYRSIFHPETQPLLKTKSHTGRVNLGGTSSSKGQSSIAYLSLTSLIVKYPSMVMSMNLKLTCVSHEVCGLIQYVYITAT